jgi:hypothetical protein
MRYEQIITKSGPMQLSIPNQTIDADGFYVSYNDTDYDIYGSDTTALVFGQMERFFILKGDHRRQYLDLMQHGFHSCLDYYKTQPAHHRSDSVDDPILYRDMPAMEPASSFRP